MYENRIRERHRDVAAQVAGECREEKIQEELREKIATGVEESSWAVRTGEPALVLPKDVADLAARVRAGEFG